MKHNNMFVLTPSMYTFYDPKFSALGHKQMKFITSQQNGQKYYSKTLSIQC